MKCHKIHDSDKDEGTNNSKTMILHTALWLRLIFDTSKKKKHHTAAHESDPPPLALSFLSEQRI
jgi:hypothetical protein